MAKPMSNYSAELPIDYVTKDYEGFLEMMKEMIPTLTPDWTDTSDSDQGIVILQLLSYGLHVLGYYQDRAVNENFLHTARNRKSILLLCKFLGYEPPGQKPAIVPLTFTKYDYRIPDIVTIPKGTKVSTNPEAGEPIVYETVEPLFLDNDIESGTVLAVQGQTVYNEILGKGNNLEDQKFTIAYEDVIVEDLEIVTRENNRDYFWERVINLFDSRPDSRHFMTTIDEEGRTIIIFGNGVTGMKPPFDCTVASTFRHGGGTFGNQQAGRINHLIDTLVDGIASVVNLEDATGGEDAEDMETSKEIAPKQYRSGGNIVTRQDCEDYALTLGGIVQAKCIETFNQNNDVNLYVADQFYEPLTQARIDYIREEIQKVIIMNQTVNVFTAEYKEYNLDLTVYIHDNFLQSDVHLGVENTLRDFLLPEKFQFGETVYLSKLIERTFYIAGVRNVVINEPFSDIVCLETELPKLSNITVNVVGGVVA